MAYPPRDTTADLIFLSALGFLVVACFLLFSCGAADLPRCDVKVEGAASSPEVFNRLIALGVEEGLFKCDLRGVVIHAKEERWWAAEDGHLVKGQTWCRFTNQEHPFDAWVLVGNARDFPAYEGSVVHELTHVAECPKMNVTHEGWESIYPRIAKVNALASETKAAETEAAHEP
jgi:hypothetical protein